MTARREVAAAPNVIAADDAMPIMTSDNPLAVAQVEEWMRVGRKGDEEQDGSVRAVTARRSSERLRAVKWNSAFSVPTHFGTQPRTESRVRC
jgi:hypothetical protein